MPLKPAQRRLLVLRRTALGVQVDELEQVLERQVRELGLLLTAVGRRSGQPWTVPLLYLRDDGDLIVCNVRPPWERRNPWPLNVRANPEVTVRIRGVAEPRMAREARLEEVERLWPRLLAMWPPYQSFFAQTHERAIFVLEAPAPNELQEMSTSSP